MRFFWTVQNIKIYISLIFKVNLFAVGQSYSLIYGESLRFVFNGMKDVSIITKKVKVH